MVSIILIHHHGRHHGRHYGTGSSRQRQDDAAIRAAIQRSQASVKELSERHGLNPKTVVKWKKRDFIDDAPMGPKEVRSTVLTPEEEAIIVAFRRYTLLCQWRSKKGPPRRCKKGPLGGCGLVPVVHGRAPRATRRALNRLTRRRAREGPVGPRGQAWAGWSVQLAVGV